MKLFLKRLLLFLTGSSFVYLTALLFDYVLYPFVIFEAGLSKGFVIMIFLSFISCVLMFYIYDYLKKDFLAIEYSKEKLELLITNNQGSRLKKVLVCILKRSKIVLFVFLSVYDPFIATVFMRKGSYQYNSLKARDWKILTLSLFIGNGIWAVTVFTGLSLFQFVLKICGFS
jgi:hypothetical protein